jgi:Mg2+/Co2+ transporter CorB
MTPLRVLNRRLATRFPLDGPKTLSGAVVEALGDIPDAGQVVDLAGQRIEVLQTQGRAVRVARLTPAVSSPAIPLQSGGGRA